MWLTQQGAWQPAAGQASLQVVTREYEDRSKVSVYSPRGGDEASTHVELLGNRHLIHDLLHAAAAQHEAIDRDVFTSQIRQITARFPHPLGSKEAMP